MKEDRFRAFSFPVYHMGELVAYAPSEERATQMMASMLNGGKEVGALDLEVVPPPPPSPYPFIGESGIPSHLFESGGSEISGGVEHVELKSGEEGIEQLSLLKKTHDLLGKALVGGKVFLTLKRREG